MLTQVLLTQVRARHSGVESSCPLDFTYMSKAESCEFGSGIVTSHVNSRLASVVSVVARVVQAIKTF